MNRPTPESDKLEDEYPYVIPVTAQESESWISAAQEHGFDNEDGAF